jgi:hypothetical protein
MAGTTDGHVQGRRLRTRGARVGAVAVAAVAVLALSACSGGADGDGAEVELERGESGVMPALERPGPEGFTSTEVEGVTIDAPDEWDVRNEGGSVCMSPPGQPECAYGSIRLTPHAAEGHPDDWPSRGDAFHDDDGWADDTGQCRSLNTAASGNIGVDSATITYQDVFEHADALKSNHTVWNVTCVNDDTFEVRMWFLPISDVLLYVWSADSQYDAVYDQIAASMDTTGYRD